MTSTTFTKCSEVQSFPVQGSTCNRVCNSTDNAAARVTTCQEHYLTNRNVLPSNTWGTSLPRSQLLKVDRCKRNTRERDERARDKRNTWERSRRARAMGKLHVISLCLMLGVYCSVAESAGVSQVSVASGTSSLVSTADPSSTLTAGNLTSCSDALHTFLDNINRVYSLEDSSLSLQGFDDYEFLQACGTKTFSLELWRAIQTPNKQRPKEFGSKEYFAKYQNCDSPNPDLLWKHGDSIRATLTPTIVEDKTSGGSKLRHKVIGEYVGRRSRHNRAGGALYAFDGGSEEDDEATGTTTEKIVFYHVVEHQYMLRLCPCNESNAAAAGGSASNAAGGDSGAANGNNNGGTVAPCSCEHAGPGAAVCSEIFNMSEDGAGGLGGAVFPWCRVEGHPSPKPQLSAPKLQQCPAQVILSGTLPSCTPVRSYDQVEVVLQPMAQEVEDCKELPREGLGRLEKLAPLNAINTTHGVFSVVISNITHDTYYCLRVELVNHPYCNSGSDHTLTRQSSVCRAVSLKNPIFIEDHVCGRPDPCEASRPNLPLITGASLAAALLLALGLILSHRMACSRRNKDRAGLTGQINGYANGRADRHRLLRSSHLARHPEVFFLYWEDSPEFVEVNRLVSRWLTGLGHNVIDLGDELVQEELTSSPESWLTDKLSDPNVKVVVADSDLANNCLRSNVLAFEDDADSTGLETSEWSGLVNEKQDQQNMHQQQQKGQKSNGSGGADKSGRRQGAAGIGNRRPADTINDLRAYSLRYVQAYLAANYRRLSVVQYKKGATKGPVANSLVPHTRHTLPQHLAELQAWLADTHGWDDNSNSLESAGEQTLRDLKAAVQRYTANNLNDTVVV